MPTSGMLAFRQHRTSALPCSGMCSTWPGIRLLLPYLLCSSTSPSICCLPHLPPLQDSTFSTRHPSLITVLALTTFYPLSYIRHIMPDTCHLPMTCNSVTCNPVDCLGLPQLVGRNKWHLPRSVPTGLPAMGWGLNWASVPARGLLPGAVLEPEN